MVFSRAQQAGCFKESKDRDRLGSHATVTSLLCGVRAARQGRAGGRAQLARHPLAHPGPPVPGQSTSHTLLHASLFVAQLAQLPTALRSGDCSACWSLSPRLSCVSSSSCWHSIRTLHARPSIV